MTLFDYEIFLPWKFTDGIEYTFPKDTTVTVAPNGRILVVKNPEAFSVHYPRVPAEIILGPYDGKLSNSGEKLELSMPGDVDDGKSYYVRVDRINYSDGSHPDDSPGSIDSWSVQPDGYGGSLTRKTAADYGNDPANWTWAYPTPGE